MIEQRKRDEAARAAQLAEERKERDSRAEPHLGHALLRLLGQDARRARRAGAGRSSRSRAATPSSRARSGARRGRAARADECVKYYESSYAVPVPGGTRLERTMRLVLRLRMDQGRVVRAELLLPELGLLALEGARGAQAGRRRRSRGAQAGRGLGARARRATLLDAARAERQEIERLRAGARSRQPAIGPTGELVDTTAEDPSAPQNRIQGERRARRAGAERRRRC